MRQLFRTSAAVRSDDPGVPRKTSEVTLERSAPAGPLTRSQTRLPALVLVEGDLSGQVFRLHEGRQVIGRRPECEIRIRDRAVSGAHAEVLVERDLVTIGDLGSTNGTLVNGLKIRRPVMLVQGSVVTTGKCVFRFVDSQLEVEFTEQLHARGITDPLTGSFNRAYLVHRLAFAIDGASPRRPVSVAAFDFDGFKQVNDTYGHAAGDAVLRESAALVAGALRGQEAVFARIGGEEFVVLMPETNLEAAAGRAERLRAILAAHEFSFEGTPIRLTCSFGVATACSASESAESLLARADELLYASKREGRNRVTSAQG